MSYGITAIIGAMDEEIVRILEELQDIEEAIYAGITYYRGRWHDADVVLCKSGVGKVNAAVCTQLLIERYRISRVLFTGVAGAVEPSLEIGDLVISTDCVQHDMDAAALGYPRGVIPFAEASTFPADADLIRLASQAGEALGEERRVHLGRVLSGDQFVADKHYVIQMREELQGACIEMEGAAVAQVCAMNRIPFVVIRSISDKADGSASMNFAAFTKQAAHNSCQLVSHMVRSLRYI